ncbi:MAG: hypothetical protein Q7R64_03230 [bacterium]|nr:hypothetical protein [bacterium]
MMWQDIVFSVGQWIFIIALIPSLLSKEKPALSTSLMTGTVLAVFAFTYSTLSLWTASVSTVLSAGTWFVLAVQKYNSDRKKHSLLVDGSAEQETS